MEDEADGLILELAEVETLGETEGEALGEIEGL